MFNNIFPIPFITHGAYIQVGNALKKVIPSVVKREDLFITSKLWNSSHRPDQVEPELDETLRQLGTDYLDMFCAYIRFSIFS